MGEDTGGDGAWKGDMIRGDNAEAGAGVGGGDGMNAGARAGAGAAG